jgi:hypothetical protein
MCALNIVLYLWMFHIMLIMYVDVLYDPLWCTDMDSLCQLRWKNIIMFNV